MSPVQVDRAGVILAVADVSRTTAWYQDRFGFTLEAGFDDPPYAIMSLAGMRLSVAEQGHPADDRPGVMMHAPADPASLQVALVLEVEDCHAAYAKLQSEGVVFLAEPYSPPWGGARCFAVDPDSYLVELEQLA